MDKEKEKISITELNNLVSLCSHALQISRISDTNNLNPQIVIQWLEQEILFLIENDMPKLIQLLYRIDISEKNTQKAFTGNSAQEIARNIAVLIFNRELQKIETRKKYKFPNE